MRITAGSAKGTRLGTGDRGGRPTRSGAGGSRRGHVRPTSGRVRGALWNALAPRVAGARVLDLFAGTGALGIEALSRGAARAVFVERSAAGAAAIRTNLVAAGLADRGQVRRANAFTEIAALARAGERFDLVVLDPPYGQAAQARALRLLAAHDLLAADGLVAVEGHWRDDPGEPVEWRRVRAARYGETGLWFYAREAQP